MNSASQWRAAVARKIAPVYASNPNVGAVMLGGSASRGQADRFSDIEIGVFWHEPPSERDRAVINRISADEVRSYPYDPIEELWEDDFMLGRSASGELQSGVLVEIPHFTVERINRLLNEVLEDYDVSDNKQSILAAISSGVPLYGVNLLARWKARTAEYPYGLALATVKAHAQIDHFWRTEMYLARGNNRLMVNDAFVQIGKQLFHMLLGLNRMYFCGFKWLDLQVAQMQIAPPDFAARLQAVFTVEPEEGHRLLSALVDETYDLIEKQMPEVDVARLRRVFHWSRPQWEEAPPGLV